MVDLGIFRLRSSGATAVLVFCGFVSGSVIINVISWTRMLKSLHTMAHIRILLLVIQRITNHAEALHCSWV